MQRIFLCLRNNDVTPLMLKEENIYWVLQYTM